MKNLYVIFVATLVLIAVLLTFTFLFLEKEKHKSFFYEISVGGKKTGYIEINLYKTEDKIIYKSAIMRPNSLDSKALYEKITFGKKGPALEKFIRERQNQSAICETVYIKARDKKLDFLSRQGSKFSAISKITYTKNISVFDESSLVTYMPYVDRYDFSWGGAQSFNMMYIGGNLLPPAKGRVILKSIRDDYITVDGKKTKTEVIVVKAKAMPQIYIWISKKDRSIVQLEIPSRAFVARKVSLLQKISAISYAKKDPSYDSREVLFPSGDIALAGTLAIPKKSAKLLPPVLLITGEAFSYDRENGGIYTDISHNLAKSGYAVLRYDRRGIGKSQGDSMSVSLADEIKDTESAVKFLLSQERVDKDRLFIIAHASAASYIARADLSKHPPKGMIFLSVTRPSFLLDFECEYAKDKIRMLSEIDRKYQKLLDQLKEETEKIVRESRKERSPVQGRWVFVTRMAELGSLNFAEGFRNINSEAIFIQGKKDIFVSQAYAADVENILRTTLGPERFSSILFRDLGHFLGDIVDEKGTVRHFELNKEALDTIKGWIDSKCADESKAVPDPA